MVQSLCTKYTLSKVRYRVEMTTMLICDLMFLMKQRTLLMYHNSLDQAAQRFMSTRDMNAFVQECNSVCQGTLDVKAFSNECLTLLQRPGARASMGGRVVL